MNQFLHSYKFDHFLNSNNVETIWDHVREAIYTAQRRFIPLYLLELLTNLNGLLHLSDTKLNACIHLEGDSQYIQLSSLNKKLLTQNLSSNRQWHKPN